MTTTIYTFGKAPFISFKWLSHVKKNLCSSVCICGQRFNQDVKFKWVVKMKIPELQNIQLNKTNELHYGQTRITTENAAAVSVEKNRRSFDDYLIQAFEKLNDQQVNVANLQQQVITDPDSVDLHDVTIAMSKARMSLNLAQTVIDRLVQGWSEITTTR